jgi:HK97 family phage prohead protease
MSEPLRVQGFAARTNVKTKLYDGVFETIVPGAFRRSISDSTIDVTFNLNHGEGGSGLPLARTTANTLRLLEIEEGPETGLWMEATLDDQDPDAQLLARKLASGALNGEASFAFRVAKNGQTWEHFDTHSVRTISAINMARGDVTAVTHGAYSHPRLGMVPQRSAPSTPRGEIPNHLAAAKREYQIMLAQAKR